MLAKKQNKMSEYKNVAKGPVAYLVFLESSMTIGVSYITLRNV